MEQINENKEINLKEIWNVIFKRLWIILLSGVVLALATFVVSKFIISPKYDSTTRIYIMNKKNSTTVVTAADLQTGSQLTKDYMKLVTSRMVTGSVISKLGLKMTHEQLVGMVTIQNPTDTRLLDIIVRYTDPLVAKQIADELRESSSDFIKDVMDIERVSVVERANLPTSPSSPNINMNTQIGGLLGVLISTGLILLLYFMNDTIKSTDDVERYLGISVLGVMPLQKSSKISNNKIGNTRRIKNEKNRTL